MKQVKVIEYSAGNLFNVVRAFEHLGCKVTLVSNPDDVNEGDFLVLPGVGAFGDGMASLNEKGLVEPIFEWINTGKPFLGICLGMQLLLTSSEEFGKHKGFGIIHGQVKRLPIEYDLKVPNIGWHSLQPQENTQIDIWKNTVLDSVTLNKDMYFVHSYAAYPEESEHWLARTSFGEHWFCSAIRKDNIYGCQFHPEKSSETGLIILRNFLNII